jgi:thiol:disulfide interchange protein
MYDMHKMHDRHDKHQHKKQQRIPGRLLSALLASALCTGLATGSTALFAQQTLQTAPARGTASLVSGNLQTKVLPVETAFELQVFLADANAIVVQWQIAKGHYLYQKSINIVRADGVILEALALPPGTTITDEYFGEVEVYFDKLSFSVLTAALMQESSDAAEPRLPQLDFTLSYQGCAEDLYCYPPQEKTIRLALP